MDIISQTIAKILRYVLTLPAEWKAKIESEAARLDAARAKAD